MWEDLAPVGHFLVKLGQGQGAVVGRSGVVPKEREGSGTGNAFTPGGSPGKGLQCVCRASPGKVPKPQNSTLLTFWGTSTFRSLSR